MFYERYSSEAGERWRCWCAECIAGIDPGYAQSWGTVRDMWNRRAVPPDPPLTLDELRKMDGEPVWAYDLTLKSLSGWGLVCEHVVEGKSRIYSFLSYGDKWLAYRRKPEEEMM